MALAESERAQILTVSEGLTRTSERTRGRASLPNLLRELDAITPRGGTDLARAIDAVVQRAPRPGMLVVLSDFLDPGPFDGAITRAASSGHDVALVQVLSDDEMNPHFDGDYALEDAETGAVVEVTLDARAIEAYLERLNGLFTSIRALAKRHRATYVRTTTTEPTIAAVRRFIARTVD